MISTRYSISDQEKRQSQFFSYPALLIQFERNLARIAEGSL